MIKKLLAILVILVLLKSEFFAQRDSCNHMISGHVFDLVTKEPLFLATITIAGTTTGTATEEDGAFQLTNLCEREFDLLISYLGYKELHHHHDFHHPDLEIYMAPDAQLLKSIVIEEKANRSRIETGTSSILTAEKLEFVQSESLGDILSKIPGVTTVKTGQNISTPMIHGLNSNRILIIDNDVQHIYQNWSDEHAPEIDPSLVDYVQVIKGAATVRYGPEALGGVILLNPKEVELSSDLDLEYKLIGKTNGRSAEGDIKLIKGFQWMTLQAGATWLKQGDLHTPEYNLSNTGKQELSYAGTARFHFSSELDGKVSFSHFNQELGVLRGAVNGNLDDLVKALAAEVPNDTKPFIYDISTPKQGNAHNMFKAELSYVSDVQATHFQYSYQINKHQEYDVRKGNDLEIPNIDLRLKSHMIDLDWTHPVLGSMNGKIGFQWSQSSNENLPGTNTVPFIPNFNSSKGGLYVIESLELDDQTLEAGLRFDLFESKIAGREPDNSIYRNTINYNNFSAIIGWKKQFTNHYIIRTNFGTAWRPPSVAELYRFGRRGTFIEYGLWRYIFDENDQVTTSDILTQEDRKVASELGYKWINTFEIHRPKFQAEITAYANYIKNYVYARPGGLSRTVRGSSPFFIYDQVDALFLGMDYSSVIKHSDLLSSYFNVSYLWARQTKDNDNFAGLPPATMNYRMDYKPKFKIFNSTTFQFGLDYTFRQFQTPRIITVEELLNAKDHQIDLFLNDASDFDIADSPSGYLLVDLLWSSSLNNFKWSVQVNNLLDLKYRVYTDRIRYFADDLGRNFTLSISYSL